MMTAAIELSRSGSPAMAEPPEKRAVCRTPAMPAVNADSVKMRMVRRSTGTPARTDASRLPPMA